MDLAVGYTACLDIVNCQENVLGEYHRRGLPLRQHSSIFLWWILAQKDPQLESLDDCVD